MILYQHFIIIRFSLAFKGKNMKPISKTLDEKRLNQKFILFERICLPSLIRQKRKNNVLVIIKITNNLPQKWKDRLKKLIQKYKFIIIQEFDANIGTYSNSLHNKFLNIYIKKSTKFIITTRLDDDDALAPNFTRIISKYINNRNINKIISFPRGYYLDTRSKHYFLNFYKLIALGLTLIQKKNNYKKFPHGAYSGKHTNWNKHTICIYLHQIMYIRTRHNVNDSHLSHSTKLSLKRGNKNIRMLMKKFPGIKI